MKTACVFPGQGSQSIGMLAELAKAFPIVEDTFSEASRALDYDLWKLVQQDPENKLNQTEFTQPALLAAGVAVWRVFCSQIKNTPDFLAGHSLGEYTALVCAGSMDFADGVRTVALRGQLMQQAVPEGQGAMAAIIGLSLEDIQEFCKNELVAGAIVVPANLNAPGQIVISGQTDPVQRVMAKAKQEGAKIVKQLSLSVPSHCPLMQSASEKFAEILQGITLQQPKIPVIHNVDVTLSGDSDAIRNALVKQLYCSVRWIETIEFFAAQGIEVVYECGPGKVLTGLNKRISKSIEAISMNTPSSFADKMTTT